MATHQIKVTVSLQETALKKEIIKVFSDLKFNYYEERNNVIWVRNYALNSFLVSDIIPKSAYKAHGITGIDNLIAVAGNYTIAFKNSFLRLLGFKLEKKNSKLKQYLDDEMHDNLQLHSSVKLELDYLDESDTAILITAKEKGIEQLDFSVIALYLIIKHSILKGNNNIEFIDYKYWKIKKSKVVKYIDNEDGFVQFSENKKANVDQNEDYRFGEYINGLENNISSLKMDEAFLGLFFLIEGLDCDYDIELSVLKSRYVNIRNKEMLNINSRDEIMISMNKLNFDLLTFIKKLERDPQVRFHFSNRV